MNSAYLALSAIGLATYSYPIEYPTKAQAEKLFAEFENNVLTNREFLKTLGPDDVFQNIWSALETFTLTLKHPGFAEEREWRVIHRPNSEASDLVMPRTVSICGAPQKVYELPLESRPELNLALDLNTLVNRVIIGPSMHALAMWRAFVDALEDAGVSDPQHKVVCSGLPLRRG